MENVSSTVGIKTIINVLTARFKLDMFCILDKTIKVTLRSFLKNQEIPRVISIHALVTVNVYKNDMVIHPLQDSSIWT